MFRLVVKRPALPLILLLALISFLPGLNWGLPSAANPETVQPWALDTIAPIAPLNEAYYRFSRAGNEYVVYPLMHYLVLGGAYAPYIAYQYLTGALTSPSASFPYGVSDIGSFSRDLTILARLVSLAMALGIVVLVIMITKRLIGENAAIWAGLSTALLATLGFYATTSNLDVPYSFWVMLAIYQYLLILDQGRTLHYALLGIFTAFAIATKDQAYGFFLLLPFALLVFRYRHSQGSGRERTWLQIALGTPMLIAAASAVVAFALANNLVFGGLDGFLRHLAYGGDIYEFREQTNEIGAGLAAQIDLLGESSTFLVQMLGPISLLLCIAGIAIAVREKRWALLSLLLPLFSYYLFVIAAFNLVFARYLLVPVLLLMPFFGLAVDRLLRWQGPRRWLGIATVTIALVSQVALVANLALTLQHDSRVVMEHFIEANVPSNARIETYVRQRMAPRVQRRVTLDVVGNSGDSITMAAVASDLTEAALRQRSPEYILLLEGLGVTGDPLVWDNADLQNYHQSLVSGTYGYREIARIETTHFLGFRQAPGTRPTSVLLARDDVVDASSAAR